MLKNTEEYLNQTLIPLRLSGITKSGWPFVISLWYVYLDEKIYLATTKTAKVVEYLLNNPKCAFEIASDIPPYCGIRGQATAKIITSKGNKILKILLNRYLGDEKSSLAQKLLNRKIPEVAIELTPIRVFQWNYTGRMIDSIDASSVKICP
ncbi:MAG: pyridoxamine 5'-phosphate oxidase family protein [Candidatus Hodarchaeota archaeon]